MDQPDTLTPSQTTSPGGEDLRTLQKTAVVLLAAVFGIGLVVTNLVYQQVVDSTRRVNEGRRIVSEFQTNALPKISWFVDNLRTFSRTNADFNPILVKYGAFIDDLNRTRGVAPANPAVSPPVPAPQPNSPPAQTSPQKK